MRNKQCAALAALVMSCTFSTPALAHDDQTQDRRQTRVSYRDLNLGDEAGIRTLDRRVRGAIRLVCEQDSVTSNLRDTMRARRCAIEAHASAQRQVDVAIAHARGNDGEAVAAVATSGAVVR